MAELYFNIYPLHFATMADHRNVRNNRLHILLMGTKSMDVYTDTTMAVIIV